MKFQYYITNLYEGTIVGTNDDKVAHELSGSDDFFVVDSTSGEWINTEGREQVKDFAD